MLTDKKCIDVFTDRFSVDSHFAFSLHSTPLVLVLLKTEPDACIDKRRDLPSVFTLRQICRVLRLSLIHI